MNQILNASLSALAAVMLTLGSIGVIVTVPPEQATAPGVITLPVIA